MPAIPRREVCANLLQRLSWKRSNSTRHWARRSQTSETRCLRLPRSAGRYGIIPRTTSLIGTHLIAAGSSRSQEGKVAARLVSGPSLCLAVCSVGGSALPGRRLTFHDMGHLCSVGVLPAHDLACELCQPSVWAQEFPSRKRVDELSVGSAAGLRWRLAQQPRFSHLSSLWDEVLGNRSCVRVHPFTSGSRTGLEPPDSARQQAAVQPALTRNHRERSPIWKTS